MVFGGAGGHKDICARRLILIGFCPSPRRGGEGLGTVVGGAALGTCRVEGRLPLAGRTSPTGGGVRFRILDGGGPAAIGDAARCCCASDSLGFRSDRASGRSLSWLVLRSSRE